MFLCVLITTFVGLFTAFFLLMANVTWTLAMGVCTGRDPRTTFQPRIFEPTTLPFVAFAIMNLVFYAVCSFITHQRISKATWTSLDRPDLHAVFNHTFIPFGVEIMTMVVPTLFSIGPLNIAEYYSHELSSSPLAYVLPICMCVPMTFFSVLVPMLTILRSSYLRSCVKKDFQSLKNRKFFYKCLFFKASCLK